MPKTTTPVPICARFSWPSGKELRISFDMPSEANRIIEYQLCVDRLLHWPEKLRTISQTYQKASAVSCRKEPIIKFQRSNPQVSNFDNNTHMQDHSETEGSRNYVICFHPDPLEMNGTETWNPSVGDEVVGHKLAKRLGKYSLKAFTI